MVRYGDTYSLDSSSDFLIYGAATTGAIVYKKLKELSVNVLAFVDKRANEIEQYYDLPVWDLKDLYAYKGNKDVCIFIAIKNVFEHEKIAMELQQIGYKKIIFRPYQIVTDIGAKDDACLNGAYDSILNGQMPIQCKTIKNFSTHVLKDNAIIRDLGDYIIANIPIQYIFTDIHVDDEGIWNDIPCLGMLAHIGLFEMLNGVKNDDWQEYIKFCRNAALRSGGIITSKAWEDSVYKNRIDVFQHMQYSWEHDKEFFVRNAVEGIYNSKGGYFNIKSGKHRNIFQIIKGSRYIPLRVKKEDYLRWSNKSKAIKIADYLQRIHCDTLPIILSNPYFYNFPTETAPFYERTINEFVKEIFRWHYYNEGKFDFSQKRILFYNSPLALYAHLFAAIGFSVFIFESNEHRRNLNAIFLEDIDYTNVYDSPLLNTEYWDILVWEHVDQCSVKAKFVLHISENLEKNLNMLAAGMTEKGRLFATLTISD